MTVRSSHLVGLSLLSIIAGCSAGTGASSDLTIDTLPGGITRTISSAPIEAGRWQLAPERTIQPADGAPGELADPGDVAITDDGTVLVADRSPATIKVFDPAGRFVRTIGRDGDGPGEFRTPQIAVRGDTLVVHDPRQRRASMFRISDGNFITTRPSACCYFYPIQIDGAGRAVARVMTQPDSLHPAQGFVRFSLDGRRLDSVRVSQRAAAANKSWYVKENGKLIMSTPVLLAPVNLEAVDPTGGFISGWSGEYLLRVTRNGGDTVALFGRRGDLPTVSAEEKAQLVTRMIKERFAESEVPEATLRASFPVADVPDHHPAFERIDVDRSGRRWIRRSSSDTTAVHFDLFDRDGRWLDEVTVANTGWARQAYQAASWGRDHLALADEDAAGRPLIQIYRITRKEIP